MPPITVPPPFHERPLADTQQHTQAWAEYYQSVTDQLADISRQLGSGAQGVTDGSDAAAGSVGEYLEASGGAVALSSNVQTNLASLNLTAGDWDVSGAVSFNAGAGTHAGFGCGIGSGLDTLLVLTFPNTVLAHQQATAVHRYNVAAPTSVPVTGIAAFTGTVTASGFIRARRVR